MIDDFVLYALVAGAGVAAAGGALGCFVVWRRMAYFGDSLAHSSLLGVVLGLAAGISPNIGIFAVCFLFAAGLLWLRERRLLATDTLLGIFAHTALAAGVFAAGFLPAQNIDLHAYLFGDILTVSGADIARIYATGAVVLLLLFFNWQRLVLATIEEDLARAEGVNTFRLRLLLIFMMTAFVALSVNTVGVLLITSLLVLPAAAARQICKSPESMAFIAAGFGVFAAAGGVLLSLRADAPSGPAIVLVAAAVFAAAVLLSPRRA